ncbi:MAG: hypothetical protein WDA16_03825 [Candidatus Thermoplasmatota archaeon]
MNCAHCGAGVISGSARCYRCQHPSPIDAAPTFDDAPSFSITPPAPATRPPSSPTRRAAVDSDRRLPVRIAAWCALALAALGMVDFARGDSAGVLVLVALQVLIGIALLKKWRFAWAGGITLASADCMLAFLAFLGGGGLSALLVAALALAGIVSLSRHGTKASLRRRAGPSARPPAVTASSP